MPNPFDNEPAVDWQDTAIAPAIAAIKANPDPVAMAQAVNAALAEFAALPRTQPHRTTVAVDGVRYTVQYSWEQEQGSSARVYLNWTGQDGYDYIHDDVVLGEVYLQPKGTIPKPLATAPQFIKVLPNGGRPEKRGVL